MPTAVNNSCFRSIVARLILQGGMDRRLFRAGEIIDDARQLVEMPGSPVSYVSNLAHLSGL